MTAECLHCGRAVSPGFVRVFGDADGAIHRCPDCDTLERLEAGSAAGLELERPDPASSPGRQAGTPAAARRRSR